MSKTATPPSPLTQRALMTIRAIAKGNGVPLKAITLGEVKEQDVTFQAGTFFDLSHSVSEKTLPGKQVVGEQIAGDGDIDRLVRELAQKVTGNPALSELLANELHKRPDKGFMLQGTTMKIPGAVRDAHWHEPCGSCDHTGRVSCSQCHGQKSTRCRQCHGQRLMQCPMCRGAGQVQGQNGTKPCYQCNGRRRINCTMCQTTGKIPCRNCRATGQMTCPTCKGQAFSTKTVHIEMTATTRCDYARGDVPEHVTFDIENHGAERAANDEITIQTEPLSDTKEIGLHYNARFPYAELIINLGKKPLKCEVYGAKARFVVLPRFLDQLMAAPLQELMSAARGEGDVAASLKKCGRYRLMALAIVTTVRANAAQTARRIREKYPQGLSPETAEKIGKAADAAVSKVTLKPRYYGLALGLMLVAAFYSAYYLGPLRGMIMPYIPGDQYNVVIDLFLIVMGGTMTTLSIQMVAKNALHKAIGHLIPPNKRKRMLPRAKASGLLGYAGGIVLYFIIVEITLHMQQAATPQWYLAMRNFLPF